MQHLATFEIHMKMPLLTIFFLNKTKRCGLLRRPFSSSCGELRPLTKLAVWSDGNQLAKSVGQISWPNQLEEGGSLSVTNGGRTEILVSNIGLRREHNSDIYITASFRKKLGMLLLTSFFCRAFPKSIQFRGQAGKTGTNLKLNSISGSSRKKQDKTKIY